jgi:hypothetical protein
MRERRVSGHKSAQDALLTVLVNPRPREKEQRRTVGTVGLPSRVLEVPRGPVGARARRVYGCQHAPGSGGVRQQRAILLLLCGGTQRGARRAAVRAFGGHQKVGLGEGLVVHVVLIRHLQPRTGGGSHWASRWAGIKDQSRMESTCTQIHRLRQCSLRSSCHTSARVGR